MWQIMTYQWINDIISLIYWFGMMTRALKSSWSLVSNCRLWLVLPPAIFHLVPNIKFSPSHPAETSCEHKFYALCRAGCFSIAIFLQFSKQKMIKKMDLGWLYNSCTLLFKSLHPALLHNFGWWARQTMFPKY